MIYKFLYLLILNFIVLFGEYDIKTDKANVNFIITDKDDLFVKNAEVIVYFDNLTNKGFTDENGKISFQLPVGKNYNVIIKKFDYQFKFDELIKISDIKRKVTINQPIKINISTKYKRKYVLQGIFFYKDSAKLKPVSYKVLDELFKSMKENPKMIIEIGGHTDDTGDDEYNLKLSQKRAEAIRDYLIKKGIQPERIKAKGYGETEPIVPNINELNRERNRRVEVKIIDE